MFTGKRRDRVPHPPVPPPLKRVSRTLWAQRNSACHKRLKLSAPSRARRLPLEERAGPLPACTLGPPFLLPGAFPEPARPPRIRRLHPARRFLSLPPPAGTRSSVRSRHGEAPSGRQS